MSCVPVSAPPAAPFRLWMRDNKGLISSISASVGGESHNVNFVKLLVASKGQSQICQKKKFSGL
jgi:hypothetical protein